MIDDIYTSHDESFRYCFALLSSAIQSVFLDDGGSDGVPYNAPPTLCPRYFGGQVSGKVSGTFIAHT